MYDNYILLDIGAQNFLITIPVCENAQINTTAIFIYVELN